MLHQSSDPLMTNSIEIFSTEEKRVIQYEDNTIDHDGLLYYQVIVEDIFGKQTIGNVVSTAMTSMPLQWNIQSVQYTANSLSVSWDTPEFDHYYSHQLLYAGQRNGNFEILAEYHDSLKYQYEGQYSPLSENWFSILTQNSIGQKSVSEPYMHAPPQVPVIDSVSYIDNSFRIQWSIEPDIGFVNYRIMFI